jgi:hypothetical protein
MHLFSESITFSIDRHVPRKPRPSGRGPCCQQALNLNMVQGRQEGAQYERNYLTGKPRPLGRGASQRRANGGEKAIIRRH